jgi:hypothetical protein
MVMIKKFVAAMTGLTLKKMLALTLKAKHLRKKMHGILLMLMRIRN